MYVPDTLNRLNKEEVDKVAARQTDCDYCGFDTEDANYNDGQGLRILEVYNPADEVRDPPITGFYTVDVICDDCYDQGRHMEERFYCSACGRLFIYNHSWDVVAVTDHRTGELYCQKCYIDEVLEPIDLGQVLVDLENGNVDGWKRINGVPGKELLWEGEFSQYSDFSGHTNFTSIRDAVSEAMEEDGYDLNTLVYPLITHGYQFSVALGVYVE